jgi:SAM-dependent methyltransferase
MELTTQLAVCPECHGSLEWAPGASTCRRCGSAFPIEQGVPAFASPGAIDEEAKRRQAEFFDAEDAEYEIERPNGTPALHAWLLAEKFRRGTAAIEHLLPGATVLTVCGGSGMDAEMLARAGASVLASDISLGAVRRAGERARRHDVSLAPLVADVEKLPFADRSVDLVYVHDGLHHLEHPYRGLDEMARVARLGVSVNEPARAALTAAAVRLGLSIDREEAGNRVARLRPAEISGRLEARGLAVAVAERYGMYYSHRPGRPVRLFSRPLTLPLARAAVQGFNAVAGELGNKLTVQALRVDGA